jgi:hypothetical protein
VLVRADTQRISLPGDPRQEAIGVAARLTEDETLAGRTVASQFARDAL